jgi:hypothetical protein
MSLSSLLTGRLPVALVSSVVTAAIVGGATVLVSAQTDGDTTLHACVGKLTGIERVPDAGKPCLKTETPLEWNQRGPEGPPGAPGEPGEDGADGAAGSLTSLDDLAGLPCQIGDFHGITVLDWEGDAAAIRCGEEPPPPSGAVLTTDTPEQVNLGPLLVPSDWPAVYTVTIKNSGDMPSNPLSAFLSIGVGQLDEWAFIDECASRVLQPEDTCQVTVMLDPKVPEPPGQGKSAYVFVTDGTSSVNRYFYAEVEAGPNFDFDGDGYLEPEDCDPGNPSVHPGAPEVDDDLDNDCDGVTDEDLGGP